MKPEKLELCPECGGQLEIKHSRTVVFYNELSRLVRGGLIMIQKPIFSKRVGYRHCASCNRNFFPKPQEVGLQQTQ